MLALAQIRRRHHQHHRANHREHRHRIGEQAATGPQQHRGPKRAAHHLSDEKRHRDPLRVNPEPAADLDGDGGDPDDEGRIDLDHVHIQRPASHPAPRDIKQPGNIVLQRGSHGREQHQRQDRAQQHHAPRANGGAMGGAGGGKHAGVQRIHGRTRFSGASLRNACTQCCHNMKAQPSGGIVASNFAFCPIRKQGYGAEIRSNPPI